MKKKVLPLVLTAAMALCAVPAMADDAVEVISTTQAVTVNGEKVDFEGQCLHARKIGFIHPKTNEYIEFTSELPDYFKKYLKKLENISSH